ncbi:hypothetical protein DPEC_G00163810 [Dallia pectoralis]|uniref:Uncharacterized protein n=1 Tax=Dallia pectoralis TaxID=75939 RepID=A0ACC2GHI5_DALPE|nr:hypothetical protein DPEC_G00163810 [Dallia pectoralis]
MERYEEEGRVNFTDMTSVERLDVMAELMFSWRKLKQSVSELQRALEVADESYTVLHAENTVLCSQNQRMKQTILDAEQLEDELEVMRSQLSEKDETLSHLRTYTQKLEDEKVSLVEQFEIITDEMSSIEQARAIDNINMANLTRSQRSLQLHLEEARVSMAQKDEVLLKKDFAYEQLEGSLSDYTSVIQNLKERISSLEIQQEEAIVNEVDHMTYDGCFMAGSRNNLSLVEEMNMLPLKMENSSDEEVEEQSVEAVREKPGLWTHVNRGLKAAGSLTLGLLVPLGIMAATLPISYEHHARGSCMDTFWSAAGSLVEQHCSTTYVTPFPQ